MHKLVALGLVLGVICIGSPASARSKTSGGPFLLVSLANLGTVTWRCNVNDPASNDRHALGFRAFATSATDTVKLRFAGHAVATRRLQPGQSIAFRWTRARVQQLRISQITETGTLRATITVDFVPQQTYSYCWPYLPPRFDVRLLPR